MARRFENTAALCALLCALDRRGYAFVAPTPSTASRMYRRSKSHGGLRDVFGWSRPFGSDDLEPEILDLMKAAGVLLARQGRLRSLVRASTVRGRLFLHSAFPTLASNSVFLGPDTYRFVDLIAHQLSSDEPVGTLLDVGAGAGVGAIIAAAHTPGAAITMTDLNPAALDLARANAAYAGVEASFLHASGLEGAPTNLDLIISNPPYMEGASGRTYRDGGDLHGARLSLDWAREGMGRLAPGGRMILYTGSAILDGGEDALKTELARAVADASFHLAYRELDPDVFGEELRRPAYAGVERIAAVAAVITRPAAVTLD